MIGTRTAFEHSNAKHVSYTVPFIYGTIVVEITSKISCGNGDFDCSTASVTR